jgi:hypothetical protein
MTCSSSSWARSTARPPTSSGSTCRTSSWPPSAPSSPSSSSCTHVYVLLWSWIALKCGSLTHGLAVASSAPAHPAPLLRHLRRYQPHARVLRGGHVAAGRQPAVHLAVRRRTWRLQDRACVPQVRRGSTIDCRVRRANSTSVPSRAFFRAWKVLIRPSQHITCGDMVFSGHAVFLMLCAMLVKSVRVSMVYR